MTLACELLALLVKEALLRLFHAYGMLISIPPLLVVSGGVDLDVSSGHPFFGIRFGKDRYEEGKHDHEYEQDLHVDHFSNMFQCIS